jgi:hypothetical protein
LNDRFLAVVPGSTEAPFGRPLGFDTLTAGPPEGDMLAHGGSEIRIGRFLFSKDEHGGADAYKPRYTGTAAGNWNALFRTAGSTGAPAVMASLFTQMGLVASPDTLKRFDAVGTFDRDKHVFPDSFGLWSARRQTEDHVPAFRIAHRITTRLKSGSGPAARPQDDIRVMDGALELRLGGGAEVWSRLGEAPTIVADLLGNMPRVLAYGEADATGRRTATGLLRPPDLQVELRLAWQTNFAALPRFIDFQGPFTRSQQGVRELEGGQPAAVLPKLEATSNATILLALMARGKPRPAIKDGASAFNATTPLLGNDHGPGAAMGYCARILPAPPVLAGKTEPGLARNFSVPLQVRMAFPLFERSRDAATTLSFHVKPDPGLEDASERQEDLFFAAALQAEAASGDGWSASIGGLAFAGVIASSREIASSGEDVKDDYFSRLIARRPASRADAARIELRLCFEAKSVLPIGLDVPRGRRLPSPIMLDETQAATPGGTALRPFRLITTETVGATQDRELRADLLEMTETARRSGSFVLISETPFAVKRAIADPLDLRGGDGGTLVARYSSLAGPGAPWRERMPTDSCFRPNP